MKTLKYTSRLYLLVLLFFFYKNSYAQVDRTFWFVAPEVTTEHADYAILLRITALKQTANVTISLPANPSFAPIKKTINANTQERIELDGWKNEIENGAIN